MKIFYTEVDKNNRQEMEDFLKNHFRYYTANSWNKATSYANNLKIHSLGLPDKIANNLYKLLTVEEVSLDIGYLISEWGKEYDYRWQVGFNGRSGGYLVLYQGDLVESEYKSYCPTCGQSNYKFATENSLCGVCGSPRNNYKTTPKEVITYPGLGTDQGEDFADWDISSLRERVSLVQDFDMLCDDVVSLAINMAQSYDVIEEEILVAKKVFTLVSK